MRCGPESAPHHGSRHDLSVRPTGSHRGGPPKGGHLSKSQLGRGGGVVLIKRSLRLPPSCRQFFYEWSVVSYPDLALPGGIS